MQNEPQKTAGNYNELLSMQHQLALPVGALRLQTEDRFGWDQEQVVHIGMELVHAKIDELLGDSHNLLPTELGLPTIRFVSADANRPNTAGYFSSSKNEIGILTDNIADNPTSQAKVFIHEYIHFLSHNGRDDTERVGNSSPLALNNNVGFRRNLGLDIRTGQEGKRTSDYFLAFNEAVTEQLAIDILPGVHETYEGYRGLLNQVIEDAVSQELGSNDEEGVFHAWSAEQFKNHIYTCFFRGDLSGFTQLLQTVYKKYDISEQQFGLMTHKSDLPSAVEYKWRGGHPNSPPPPPGEVARMVQMRLDSKTPADYITDVDDPEPGPDDDENMYGAEYDKWLEDNNITATASKINIRGKEYELDSFGYVIYRGEEAQTVLENIKSELDSLLVMLDRGQTSANAIADQMDVLLFEKHEMSMLSDGFRDFYIYKHTKLGNQ